MGVCRLAETKSSVVCAWGGASCESLACRSKRLLRAMLGAVADVLGQHSTNLDTARGSQPGVGRGEVLGQGVRFGGLVEANLFAGLLRHVTDVK